MYFPVLRGKQNELLALREIKQKLATFQVIKPIIEPVKSETRQLLRCLEELGTSGIECILICNPMCGELENNNRKISELVTSISNSQSNTSFAYYLHEGSTLSEVNDFLDLIGDRRFYFIHRSAYAAPVELMSLPAIENLQAHIFIAGTVSRRYQQQFANFNCVVIADNFNKLARNADYSSIPVELFSDQYLTYRDDRLHGFGDFLTIGSDYSEGGWAAYTVAIHLTFEDQASHEVWIRHFLSNTRTVAPAAEAPEMVQEALEDVANFLDENTHIEQYSTACAELRDMYESGRSTNLGTLKKLSVKNHMELMIHLLSR